MDQLIYGSADQIVGRSVGGWGVLHSTAALAPDIQRRLLGLVSVSLPVRMPQFPSAAELATREPRFRAEADGGLGFVARSVEAGKDHTGRPGNVVTHAAQVSLPAGARCADWFFAGGWVAPFGPQQIVSALLPQQLGEPDGWAAAADWLRANPTRLTRLRGFAEAATQAMLAGKPLLLRADSVSELARWASVLTRLIDDAAAERVALRLGEDQHSLAEALASGGLVGICFEPDPTALGAVTFLDATAAPGAGADHPIVDLAFAAQDVAEAVFASRDELVHAGLTDQRLALQAAWLLTPGAQPLAREEPIRELLDDLEGVKVPQLAALAAEVGEQVEAPQLPPDIYALAAVEPEPEPAAGEPVREAIIAANLLGRSGIEVGWLLEHGTLLTNLDRYPPEQSSALRAIAAVLNIDGEDN